MNRIRLFFATAMAVAVLGVGLISSPVFAVTYFPPVTTFEDDDLDYLVKGSLGGVPNTQAGIIQVGDRLAGVAEFNQTAGVFGGGPAPIGGGQELTAVFDITLAAKVQTGHIEINGTPGQQAGEPSLFTFVFVPTGVTGLLGAQPVGAMTTLYLDGSPDLTVVPPNCTTLAACVALANDGAVYMDLGFSGDVNNLWNALNALDDTTVVAGAPASTKLGAFNFFLSVLTNNTGQTIVDQACLPFCAPGGDGEVQVIGSGDILGGQGLPGPNGAFARSDTDFQIATAVPEPSALLLLGSGLLGLNFISRRRQKK